MLIKVQATERKTMLNIIKTGYREIFANKFKIIAIIGIILISLCFGLLCVKAFWNPQNNIKDLPVAVVNLDKGEAGDKIVDKLKGNDSVKWEPTEENIFKSGIEETDYYFAFLIPEDFTEKTRSAQGDDPKAAEIYYYSNVRKNFLLSQLSTMVKSEFSKNISEAVTKEYTIAAFDSLYDIKDGLAAAGAGSARLHDGAESLDYGIGKLTDGAGELADGTNSISKNTEKYSDKMKNLYDGTSTLKEGAAKLRTSSAILADSVSQLNEGAETLASGASTLKAGITTANSKYSQGMYTLLNAYKNIAADPDLTDAQKLGALAAWEQKLEGAYSSYMESQDTIETGISTLSSGASDLKTGTGKLNDSMPTLESATLSLSRGAENIYTATGKLYDWSAAINSGAAKLSSGASTLDSGTEKIGSGAHTLSTGIGTMSTGLDSSYEKLDGSLLNSSGEMGEFVSDPVEAEDVIYGDVANYGTGFAPLFMSLGLWLGALMLFFLIDVRPDDYLNRNRFSIVFGKYTVFASFALIEALAVSCSALLIGVSVTSIPMFILFTMTVSLTFVAVIQFLHLAFGFLVSKGLSVFLIILQISSAGGTFPAELCGGFFQTIHPYLPFSYTIDGFREVLSGGSLSGLIFDVGHLAFFAVILFALSLLVAKRVPKFKSEAVAAN